MSALMIGPHQHGIGNIYNGSWGATKKDKKYTVPSSDELVLRHGRGGTFIF